MKVCFFVDKNLGKLTKWLRLLGFDTLSERDVPIDQCRYPNERIVATRSRVLFKRCRTGRCLLIRSDHWFEQLRQVIEDIGIDSAAIRPFTRCLHCNDPIESIDRARIYGKVPDHIWDTHHEFMRCDRCDRIYWPGSHPQHSAETINRLFEPHQRAHSP